MPGPVLHAQEQSPTGRIREGDERLEQPIRRRELSLELQRLSLGVLEQLDQAGEVLLHKNIRANPDAFLKAVANYREDLVVAVECIFTWYWLADLCRSEGIHFVLGHALYMKAIHGGKAKNDRIDAEKVAILLA